MERKLKSLLVHTRIHNKSNAIATNLLRRMFVPHDYRKKTIATNHDSLRLYNVIYLPYQKKIYFKTNSIAKTNIAGVTLLNFPLAMLIAT